jgi:hypothetical protein
VQGEGLREGMRVIVGTAVAGRANGDGASSPFQSAQPERGRRPGGF